LQPGVGGVLFGDSWGRFGSAIALYFSKAIASQNENCGVFRFPAFFGNAGNLGLAEGDVGGVLRSPAFLKMPGILGGICGSKRELLLC
jgi:hypothetical protein